MSSLQRQINLARALVARGRPQDAVVVLDRLGGAHSRNLYVLGTLRTALENLGRHREAQTALRRSAEVRAGDGFLFQAIAECKAALRLDPGEHGPIHLQIAGYYAAAFAGSGLTDQQDLHRMLAVQASAAEGYGYEC